MTGVRRGGGELIRVLDPEDPRLGDYAALTDAALRKRYEHEQGVLIAEGPTPVRALVTSSYPVRSLLIAERRLSSLSDVLARTAAPVYVVPQDVLEALVRFRLHQGVLGCGLRRPPPAIDDLLTSARTIAVLEGLGDHENLGTLFRSARALGVDAVILGPGCADPLYRRSVRVSMGHVLHVPHARCDDAVGLLEMLHGAGFTTLALTPDPSARPIETVTRARGARVALLLGAEGPGLGTATLEGAHQRVRIPMAEGVDSINVAAAGAVAFQAVRA
ncbi:MAG: RNA methyltransferase [Nitriliruptoraceae bacterium]